MSARTNFSTPELALAYFTECELATLGGMRIRPRTPKGELARHESIAKAMVEACHAFKITPEIASHASNIRLAKWLGQYDTD